MKSFNLQRREVDLKALKHVDAQESDCANLYSEPGVYLWDNRVAIIIGKLEFDEARLLRACKNIRYTPESRTTGMTFKYRKKIKIGESRPFGFKPRVGMTSNFCSISSLALDDPGNHETLLDLGVELAKEYAVHGGAEFISQKQLVDSKVLPCWRLRDTPFTSGIVNKNNKLRYHHDAHNVPGVFSCMAVLRKDCEGGILNLPEFDAAFYLDNMTYILFDGQAILHGVTPLIRKTSRAYRYSVVYYALNGMTQCGTPQEEVQRANQLKMAALRKRSEAYKKLNEV